MLDQKTKLTCTTDCRYCGYTYNDGWYSFKGHWFYVGMEYDQYNYYYTEWSNDYYDGNYDATSYDGTSYDGTSYDGSYDYGDSYDGYSWYNWNNYSDYSNYTNYNSTENYYYEDWSPNQDNYYNDGTYDYSDYDYENDYYYDDFYDDNYWADYYGHGTTVQSSRRPIVKATKKTGAKAARKGPFVRASKKPIVKQSMGQSYVSFEIGNFQFVDDQIIQE